MKYIWFQDARTLQESYNTLYDGLEALLSFNNTENSSGPVALHRE